MRISTKRRPQSRARIAEAAQRLYSSRQKITPSPGDGTLCGVWGNW